MENDRSDILLFIDLGFILLVGFLILTETTPEAEVPLPNESQEERDPAPLYEVQFDERMQFLVLRLPQSEAACVPASLATLAGCLEQTYRQNARTIFVLSPQGEATVQQLVSMLDLCSRRGWQCTVNN
ncbi:MAG: hypothetical protein F4Y00_06840 [Bacteroidetes bacterium SB0662_bin_6]|nr:hypothetical protein [Bacteroidetes bacterium SB0668_bin_1]MYE04668.1 hypothetical protein [Bacteroidetes bacterium SB0662_bin_6]